MLEARRVVVRVSLLVLCDLFVACGSGTPRTAIGGGVAISQPAGAPQEAMVSSSIATTRGGASAVTSTAGGATMTTASTDATVQVPAQGAKAPREVNLLQITESQVAVSSAVHNPRDFPEFLVDGLMNTAWQSTTGDLISGWIEFRVPKETRLSYIELTAGYSRVKDKVDLFTANYRISRVEVFRNGTSLGTFALDVNNRALQRLNVSGEGGEYRIVVKGVVPGTKREWRELAVSELRVMGEPNQAKLRNDTALRVAVGGLDAETSVDFGAAWSRELEVEQAAYPSPAAYCEAYVKKETATAPERLQSIRDIGIGIEHIGTPSCVVKSERYALPERSPFQDAVVLRLHDGLRTYSSLLVKLGRGYVSVPATWAEEDPTDPGCPSIFRPDSIEPPRVDNGYLVIVLLGYRENYTEEEILRKNWGKRTRGAVWCKDETSRFACWEYSPEMTPSLGAFSIAPDGSLRLQGRGLDY